MDENKQKIEELKEKNKKFEKSKFAGITIGGASSMVLFSVTVISILIGAITGNWEFAIKAMPEIDFALGLTAGAMFSLAYDDATRINENKEQISQLETEIAKAEELKNSTEVEVLIDKSKLNETLKTYAQAPVKKEDTKTIIQNYLISHRNEKSELEIVDDINYNNIL